MQKINKLLHRMNVCILGMLVLLLVLFLWLQWPSRVFAMGNPRMINDMGQLAFAFFCVIAYGVATVTQSHLQISKKIKSTNTVALDWIRFALTLPWSILIFLSALPLLINSWHENEKFPETYSPGFYLIKFALLMLPVIWLISHVFLIKRAYRDKSCHD